MPGADENPFPHIPFRPDPVKGDAEATMKKVREQSTAIQAAEMAASDLGAPGFSFPEPNVTAGLRALLEHDDPMPAPTLPAWLIDADAEERRELEELGVTIDPSFAVDAERDAMASRLMRAHREHAADMERYDAAEALEHRTITARYDRLRSPAKHQMMRLAAFILYIVSSAVFGGKKKSRTVGWGSFGLRKERDKVDIINMVEVVAYVRKAEPQSVRLEVATTAKVQQDVCALLDTAIASGQLQLAGTDVSVLSELRAQLRGGIASVSKTVVSDLLKMQKPTPDGGTEPMHPIPGASITIGVDKPWFEVEPPVHG